MQSRQNGDILYASAGDQQTYGGIYAETKTLVLDCTVKKGTLQLKNVADGTTWDFAYTLDSSQPEANAYALTCRKATVHVSVTEVTFGWNVLAVGTIPLLYALLMWFIG